MQAGDLRHFVVLHKRKQEQDEYGAMDDVEQDCKHWKPYCEDKKIKIRAALDFSLGSSTVGAEKRLQPNTCTMTVRRLSAYKMDCEDFVWIPIASSYYRIVSIIPDGYLWLVVELERES